MSVVYSSSFHHANGLRHHVRSWSLPDLAAEAPVAWLLHGYLDAGQSWAFVGEHLAHAGIRVYAPDLRGFGETDRSPRGAYYHFPEYIADQVGLLRTMNLRGVFLVGHSMGGTVATLLAAAFPEFAKNMALLEGYGPPDTPWEEVPDRLRGWVEDSVKFTPAPEDARKAMSIADAARRLRMNHPNVSVEQLERITNGLTLPLEGGVKWAFDPLHRARSAVPFFAKSYCAFAKLVKCPVLAVSGGENGFHVPDERERLACFANCREVALEGAGHMMHWTRPEETAKALLQFWAA